MSAPSTINGKLLPMVECAYNNTYHNSMGTSPFWLVYSQDPRTPVTLYLKSTEPAAAEFVQVMETNFANAKKISTRQAKSLHR